MTDGSRGERGKGFQLIEGSDAFTKAAGTLPEGVDLATHAQNVLSPDEQKALAEHQEAVSVEQMAKDPVKYANQIAAASRHLGIPDDWANGE